MEIKQGDKVRVSSRLPRIYERFGSMIAPHYECKVVEIDDGMALLDSIPAKHIFLFPLKYLIKVDAEAKEPKFKVGDKVCINKSSLKHGLRGEILTIIGVDVNDKTYLVQSICMRSPIWLREDEISLYTAPTIKVGDRVCCYNVLHLKGSKKEDYMGIVTSITDMGIMVQLDNGGAMLSYRESDLELVQPKEQTEVEKTDSNNFKKEAEEWANTVSNAIKEYGDVMCQTYIDAHTEAYWDAYTADLAKEIAVKVTNKYSDPTEAAEYAVRVAKAVVENLKNEQI